MNRRREFITLLGSAAAAWPLAARAQQSGPVRRVGVLIGFGESDPEGQARLAAFQQGLQALGWTDGGNVRIYYRRFVGDPDRIRAAAAELVGLKPDVILAYAPPAVAARRRLGRSRRGRRRPNGSGVLFGLAESDPEARNRVTHSGRGIASWPLGRIERAVRPDGAQRSALKELQDATTEAANLLRSDCPTRVRT